MQEHQPLTLASYFNQKRQTEKATEQQGTAQETQPERDTKERDAQQQQPVPLGAREMLNQIFKRPSQK